MTCIEWYDSELEDFLKRKKREGKGIKIMLDFTISDIESDVAKELNIGKPVYKKTQKTEIIEKKKRRKKNNSDKQMF